MGNCNSKIICQKFKTSIDCISVLYTGADFIKNINLFDENDNLINPTTLSSIHLILFDDIDNIVAEYKYPTETNYEELSIYDSYIQLRIPSSITSNLIGSKLNISIKIVEENTSYPNGIKTMISACSQIANVNVTKIGKI
jgi:hypothetical protein